MEMRPVERRCTWYWASTDTTISKRVWIGIDRTPPQLVGLRPGRPPDANGWFNRPVGLTFMGRDTTSGVASCSSTTFSGPDGQGVPVSGSCRDVAGNSRSGSLPINYDSTKPRSPAAEAVPGNHRIALSWRSSSGAQVRVSRLRTGRSARVLYRGRADHFVDKRLRNKRRYRYAVTLIDQAGNRSVDKISAVPTSSPLLVPANGAHLKRPPELRWKKARKARYYNAQLVRNGRKVLSIWPRRNHLQLSRSWRFAGRRYRFVSGHYCWYVWPGLGARSERRYGRLLGKSCFTVRR